MRKAGYGLIVVGAAAAWFGRHTPAGIVIGFAVMAAGWIMVECLDESRAE